MKIYISADIEGVAGIAHWDEANKTCADYREFREAMTDEVLAACEGAIAAGATEIVVKDAHASGRNILATRLPKAVRLIRGWSGHPFSMVQELDQSFTALLFIGYHSKAGADTNPLAHTMSSRKVFHIKVNGEQVSEFILHSYAAGLVKVPVAFLSGDKGLTEEAHNFNEAIYSVATMRGIGDSVIAENPLLIRSAIRAGVERALSRDLTPCHIHLPRQFKIEITFKSFQDAYKASFYPGVQSVDERTIAYTSSNFLEVLTMIGFVIN